MSNLKGQFSVINGAITELKLCLKEDIKQIEDSFKLKLNEATISAAEAKALSTMNTIAIQEIWSEMNILKKECLVLKRENEELKKQSNDMETYSRKNNIIFNGIPEVLGETNALCESAVRAFLRNTLKIDGAVVDGIQFILCHRLRAQRYTMVRPIIVRFRDYSDRECVWKNMSHSQKQ